MGVPTTGNFSMFGSGDNTTIAGAIVEGGANAGTVAATTDFNTLKGLADITRFDATYSEGATTLAQVTKTLQFRGYPTPAATTTTTSTTTTTTTLAPCSITIYFNNAAVPSPGGWDTQLEACQGTGTALTVYTTAVATCPTTFQEIFNDGKILYTNSALTTVLAGGSKYFKDTAAANSGNSVQVGNDGLVNSNPSACGGATTTTTTSTTTTTTAAPTTTTTTTAGPTTTTTTTAAPTTTTTTTAAPTTTTTTTAGPGTTTTTTSTTTTTTTTAAPSNCTLLDITILQEDLDLATGNTVDPSRNGTVYVEFTACDGTPTTIAYGGPITTQRCADIFGSSPIIYLYQNDTQQNADQGSSISDSGTPCVS